MHKIKAYKISDKPAVLSSLPTKRDWMEETSDRHAYRCFPVTLSNSLGWSISFPEDISFVWDGVSDSSNSHVKILSGSDYVTPDRSNATVSFNTGINFETQENLSMVVMPAPNQFYRGAQCFTTIISTSFFQGQMPVVWRITEPYKVITIKAYDPVASILPISLTELQDSEVSFLPNSLRKSSSISEEESRSIVSKILESGNWTNFYRNGVDMKGNKIGSHEVKSIRLNIKGDNDASN